MANDKTSEAETERPPAGPAVGMEEVYYAALPSLDSLASYPEKALVVMNWIKYITLTRARDTTDGSRDRILDAFDVLCLDFALKVIELPRNLPESFDHGCPGCVHCGRVPN